MILILAGFRFDFDLIWLAFDSILVGFGWIWLDFDWIWLDFGLIRALGALTALQGGPRKLDDRSSSR